MLLVALMSVTILAQAALEGFSLVRVVQTTAVLSGLVPYGLFFLVSVAYTVGAANSAARGALVQRVNAVESVSNVDVVCTDKTGTLTTGRLTVQAVSSVGPLGTADVERLVGSMARSAGAATGPALPWPPRCRGRRSRCGRRSRSPPPSGGARCSPTTASSSSGRRTPWRPGCPDLR